MFEHIFRNCDFVVNIWYIMKNNSLNPLNSSLGFEYLWTNKHWLRKHLTITMRKLLLPFGLSGLGCQSGLVSQT